MKIFLLAILFLACNNSPYQSEGQGIEKKCFGSIQHQSGISISYCGLYDEELNSCYTPIAITDIGLVVSWHERDCSNDLCDDLLITNEFTCENWCSQNSNCTDNPKTLGDDCSWDCVEQ